MVPIPSQRLPQAAATATTTTRPPTFTWLLFHSSRLTERTKEMCTPRLRWMPLHRMQMKVPRVADAHLGPAKGARAQHRRDQRVSHGRVRASKRRSRATLSHPLRREGRTLRATVRAVLVLRELQQLQDDALVALALVLHVHEHRREARYVGGRARVATALAGRMQARTSRDMVAAPLLQLPGTPLGVYLSS